MTSTALKDGYERVEQDLPAFEDLEGAARALMRLQDVYMLNVKGLAGVFRESQALLSLTCIVPGDFSPSPGMTASKLAR